MKKVGNHCLTVSDYANVDYIIINGEEWFQILFARADNLYYNEG